MGRRSVWRYGPNSPPTPGPSSQSIPSHCRASCSETNDSSVTRLWWVSSMRRTNAPPWCGAKSQSYSAVRAPPTWRSPLGAGAYRTRTRSDTRSHRVLEHADPFHLDLHRIARLQPADAGRGPGQDEVPGEQRHHVGDERDELGRRERHVGRPARLPHFSVHPAGHLDVG